jgi:lipopolysaccharide export system protein LptA
MDLKSAPASNSERDQPAQAAAAAAAVVNNLRQWHFKGNTQRCCLFLSLNAQQLTIYFEPETNRFFLLVQTR